jgi:hypothetical protein
LAVFFVAIAPSLQAVQVKPTPECVPFASARRLAAGESFQLRLPRNLEFVLADDDGAWSIVIRPVGDSNVNFVDVTPPVQTRPHAYIGARYMNARDSVRFGRELGFVITREDYASAVAAIAASRQPPYDAAATLAKLNTLMKGRLRLKIEDHSLARVPARDQEQLEWISFSGDICVPAS